MQIPYFAANQNVVFIPALLVLLVATVLFCLPIIFGPGLRKSKRRTPLLVVDGVLVLVLLVGAALLAVTGFRTLGDERADVQAQIQQRYDVDLNAGQVGELVDGGRPAVPLPTQAEAAGLDAKKDQALRLVPKATDADTYVLTIGGKPWPAS